MPTPNKIQIVEETQKRFEESSGIYFTRYTGVNVTDITGLRDKFREQNVEYKVIKNTLVNIAAKNAGYDGLDDVLNGQIGIAFTAGDPSSPARVIKDFLKTGTALEVVGILFEGQQYASDKFGELANLPTREELLAKLLNGLQQPMTKLAATLNASMTKLAGTLDSLKNTKS